MSEDAAHILMVAAENDALPGGKVGGIGDVVRSVPTALAERGCKVTVLTPAYGVFAELPGARRIDRISISFTGLVQSLGVYEVPGRSAVDGVRHVVIDHPDLSPCGRGRIYCDDPPDRPFASDASKFALFCTAAAQCIAQGLFGELAAVHLHDWHAAYLLILRRYHRAYVSLRKVRCAFTIHNLSLQGVRPFAGDASALESWYPGLKYETPCLADPRWPDCVNPMASAIRLADAVHAVSPTYAEEILSPSDVAARGRFGGEGLEADLCAARDEGRLFGILNGCEYPERSSGAPADWTSLLSLMRSLVMRWTGASATVSSAHFIAHSRLGEMSGERPEMIVTSIGRATEQKLRLLRQATRSGSPAIEGILETLGERGVLLLLGSGDTDYEQFLTATAAKFSNFVFLNGYSDELSQALYGGGDLFLMPSFFEPCGISQMLALRAGQPCLVHDVGGLRDTVVDGVTGFSFTGDDPIGQAEALVAAMQKALQVHQQQPDRWEEIRRNASAARFRWSGSIDAYLDKLYRIYPSTS